MPGRRDEGEKVVASNRKARHDYEILETHECGIQLTGDEVKSLRAGRASLADCYGRVRAGEAWLEGMHVPPYEQGDQRTHQPTRPRKLLLHRREIDRLAAEVAEKGLCARAAARLLHARHRQGRARARQGQAPAREAPRDRGARRPA